MSLPVHGGLTGMGNTFVDISVSLDGFVAGPNAGLDHPLGEGGEQLHEWALKLKGWRASHGRSGGESNASDELMAETLARQGAVVMGRQMFGGSEGPWGDEPWEGWWGDEPPFGVPVFVVTHHERELLAKGATTFTFVTEGVEAAVEQARKAAGEKDVLVAGGADVVQQAIRAGLVDDLQLHVAPVLLHDGRRLLENLGAERIALEKTRVVDLPDVTHLAFRVG